MVNQKHDSSVHTHGYNDLVKVIITTLSIILFNIEDNVILYFNFHRVRIKIRAWTCSSQFYLVMVYL